MDRIVPAVLVNKSEPSFQSFASKGFILLKAESKATPGSSVTMTHAFLQFSTPASAPSSCDDSPMPTVPFDGWGDSSCRMHRWAQRIRADFFLIQSLHLQAAGSAAPVPLLLGMEAGAYSTGLSLCFTSASAGAGVHGAGGCKYKSVYLNSYWDGTLQSCSAFLTRALMFCRCCHLWDTAGTSPKLWLRRRERAAGLED